MRRPEARLIVVAVSTSLTCARQYAEPIPTQTHQTSADALATAAKGDGFSRRPLCVSDREAFRTLYARLSPDSRDRRFLIAKPKLSERELTYLTDIDHARHETLAGIDRKDGPTAGVAGYVTWPERAGAADVAIEIAQTEAGGA